MKKNFFSMQLVIHMISEANQEETQGKSKPWLAEDLISFATVSHLIFFNCLVLVFGFSFFLFFGFFSQIWYKVSAKVE